MVVTLVEALEPEWSAFILVMWVLWEFHAPTLLDRETTISPLLEVPERVENVEEKQETLVDKIEDIDDLQTDHVQVTRATARAVDDDVDAQIDSDAVDQYLVKGEVPIVELTNDGTSADD